MNYNVLAKKILMNMGGKSNISYFGHCMSRIRFAFVDISKVNFNELKKVREIMAVVRSGEEVYMVVKNGVPYLYSAIKEKLADNCFTTEEGHLKKYINNYKGIVVSLFIISVIKTIMNAEVDIVFFGVVFLTVFSSYAIGVIADVLLSLIKVDENDSEESGINIISPLKGKVLKNSDSYISKENIVLIYPDINTVFSPVDGRIEEIYKTKHAIFIRSKMGFGVSIHIGVDTFDSKESFTTFVEKGDYVSRGEAILEFDGKRLKEQGYDLTTAVEVVDYDNKWKIGTCEDYATENRCLIKLLKK